jgi:hypothetical protein
VRIFPCWWTYPKPLEIARISSLGHLVVEAVPALRPLFDRLATRLAALAGDGPQREPIRSDGGIDQDLGPQPRRDEAVPGSGSLDVGDACQASPIREVVVLSGKGGTGKTSIAACLVAVVDCQPPARAVGCASMSVRSRRWIWSLVPGP